MKNKKGSYCDNERCFYFVDCECKDNKKPENCIIYKTRDKTPMNWRELTARYPTIND